MRAAALLGLLLALPRGCRLACPAARRFAPRVTIRAGDTYDAYHRHTRVLYDTEKKAIELRHGTDFATSGRIVGPMSYTMLNAAEPYQVGHPDGGLCGRCIPHLQTACPLPQGPKNYLIKGTRVDEPSKNVSSQRFRSEIHASGVFDENLVGS